MRHRAWSVTSNHGFGRGRKKVTPCRKLGLPAMTDPTSPIDSLGELMRAAQQGDGASYVELLRTITPRIRQIIRRQRGFVGVAEVEDLVQDVLLSVHTVRATYDPARPFIPWLLAIVRNRLVDGARRYARIARREIHVDEEDVTFFAAETNDDIGELGDAAAVREAVRALPDGQRRGDRAPETQGAIAQRGGGDIGYQRRCAQSGYASRDGNVAAHAREEKRMNTNDLIENLARGLEPVAPLWRPGTRAAMWLLGAVAYVGILVVGMSAVKADSSGCRRGFLGIADRCHRGGAAGKPSGVRLCGSRFTYACARVGGVGGARLARDARRSVTVGLRLGDGSWARTTSGYASALLSSAARPSCSC